MYTPETHNLICPILILPEDNLGLIILLCCVGKAPSNQWQKTLYVLVEYTVQVWALVLAWLRDSVNRLGGGLYTKCFKCFFVLPISMNICLLLDTEVSFAPVMACSSVYNHSPLGVRPSLVFHTSLFPPTFNSDVQTVSRSNASLLLPLSCLMVPFRICPPVMDSTKRPLGQCIWRPSYSFIVSCHLLKTSTAFVIWETKGN